MDTTSFWLLHAAFAGVSGAVFILFKLFLSRHFADAPPAELQSPA